jgi:hypothetical protein
MISVRDNITSLEDLLSKCFAYILYIRYIDNEFCYLCRSLLTIIEMNNRFDKLIITNNNSITIPSNKDDINRLELWMGYKLFTFERDNSFSYLFRKFACSMLIPITLSNYEHCVSIVLTQYKKRESKVIDNGCNVRLEDLGYINESEDNKSEDKDIRPTISMMEDFKNAQLLTIEKESYCIDPETYMNHIKRILDNTNNIYFNERENDYKDYSSLEVDFSSKVQLFISTNLNKFNYYDLKKSYDNIQHPFNDFIKLYLFSRIIESISSINFIKDFVKTPYQIQLLLHMHYKNGIPSNSYPLIVYFKSQLYIYFKNQLTLMPSVIESIYSWLYIIYKEFNGKISTSIDFTTISDMFRITINN